MDIPLRIAFQGMEPSPTLEDRIREKAAGLSRYHAHIVGGRVVIERLQKHSRQGDLFTVRLELTVPGGEIAVSRERDPDVYVALRDAFDAARRRLEDRERRERGTTKVHDEEFLGQVVRIFPEEGFGFIASEDGRDIYFNRDNCTHPSFDRLDIGNRVRFLVAEGAEGPQARRVTRKADHGEAEAPGEASSLA